MHSIDNINITFEIPDWIQRGLENGSLFRDGGTVRRSDGAIAAFLKESVGLSRGLADGSSPSSPLLASQMTSLKFISSASLGMQVLNLGVSAVGFTIVISKLNKIQSQLKRLSSEVRWVSRKQDLTLIAGMKSALEIAEDAMHASNKDDLVNGLKKAIEELIKAANTSETWLSELISTRDYLSKPELFGLYYRTWACSRIAIVQSYLSLEDSELAMRAIQRMCGESESFHKRYLEVLQNFDIYLLEHFAITPQDREKLIALDQCIAETTDRIKGYKAEIGYIQKNNIPYREWVAVGESEEPKLIVLLPKNGRFPE